MKRLPLLLSLAVSLTALAAPAAAAPLPDAGGPAELLRYVGDPSSATGNAVANGQCDVNGDSTDDAVVGAWFWDRGAVSNLGAAYVLLGGRDVRGGSLGDPAAVGAIRIDGPVSSTGDGTLAAVSVACIGDVNGDGLDDIGISGYTQQRTYVVFGDKNFSALTLDSLGSRGYVAQAPATAGNFGYSIAPVGDIDDDGLDDFAVAEIGANTQGRDKNGRVWILAGRDDVSDVDIAHPAAGQIVLTVDGALDGERLGGLSAAGDVNGDGIDDFVLGSYTSTPWGSAAAVPGAAYVVFGGATGTVDLASLGDQGFAIYGPARQRDRLGISISPAGDVNGDGLADLIVGADGVDNATTGPRNGGAAVVLGSASTSTVYTDPAATKGQSVFTCPAAETPPTCATPARRGYWINGAATGDSTGYSVAGISDVNRDGIPDFALGAYGFDPVNPANPAATMSTAGAVYVVFGKKTGAVQNLSALDDASGYRIDGLKAGDRFGRQVGLIGDFDGNGSRDVVASGDFASRSAATGAQNGEIVIALMGKLDTKIVLDGPETAAPDQSRTFTAAVSKAGDPAVLATGTVTFRSDGSPIAGCKELPVAGGDASCTTSWSTRSEREITAVFNGTGAVGGSTSDAHRISVAAGAVIRPSATPSFTYGTAPAALTGEIRGTDVLPTGTVELREGDVVIGTADVQYGEYAIALGATALKPGAHALTLVYGGDGRTAAAERTMSVSVAKAASKLSVARSRGTLKGKQRLTLTITASARGVVPTGTVKIKIGSKVVKTVKLTNGRARYKLPKLGSKGTRKVSVVYSGSAEVAASTSAAKNVVQK